MSPLPAPVVKLKNAVLPDEIGLHKIRRGIAKGAVLPINLNHLHYMVLGLYEREIVPWILEWIDKDPVLYDIGAGPGYYTSSFALRARSGSCVAVDCDAPSIAWLEKARADGGLGPADKVEIVEAMLGASTDPVAGTTSLDDLISNRSLPPPVLIKMDVEGAELDILKGAVATIADHHPAILIEVHSTELRTSCTELLESGGYRVRTEAPRLWPRDYRPFDFNGWIFADRPPSRG